MGKSLLKCNKLLTINALPITSGYNKSGIQQTVKNFKASTIQKCEYTKTTQRIESILTDVYDKFPLQSFDGSIETAVRSSKPKTLVKVTLHGGDML